MKRNVLIPLYPIVFALIILSAFLYFARETRAGVSAAISASNSNLVVDGVYPDEGSNDIQTPIVIMGSGFSATISGTQVITPPTVYLGNAQLPEPTWVDSTTLNTAVSWGLVPDVYTLTVVNPNGVSSTLTNAFTVTEGLGEFVTGGPYGGMAVQLALKPDDATNVYATMFGAGLFLSENGAENWEPIHDHDWPIQLDFDSGNPDILYYGADSNDMYRSPDNGSTWVRISEDFHTQNGCFQSYPVAHPSQPGWVYFGMGSCGGDINLEPGEGGVFFSTDYGDNWSARNSGLSDLDVHAIAVHPNTPNTLLAGTFDGDLFYSTNGGTDWVLGTQLTGTVSRLYFNPYEPLEAWAITRSDAEGRGYLYRSTNLTDWTTSSLTVQPQGGSAFAQMAFLPASVWLASINVYSSTNSGTTWNEINGPNRSAAAIAISPADPDTIYIGTDFGVEKTTNGGSSWSEMIDGLAAMVPNVVAASPNDPDKVYVKTHQGIYASQNGGNDWQYLDYGTGGFNGHQSLAIDYFSGTRLYLNAGCQDQFCIDISPDGGATWNLVTSTLPATYAGWSCESFAILPSLHTSGKVFVGASLTPPGGGDVTSIFYISDSYGTTWNYVLPPTPITRVTEIASDAFNPDLLYAATSKTGLWRSIDGGANWEHVQIANSLPPVGVSAVEVHPNFPNKVYIRSYSFAASPNPESELWVSENAGNSWQPLTSVFLGVDLMIAPRLQDQIFYSLYTGCEAGLCRSVDDGITWHSIEGISRPEILNSASDGARSIIYLGIPGGLVNTVGGQAASPTTEIPGRGNLAGSGVYRLVTPIADKWIYLPLILR